jgi:invasion protein IalB
MEISLGRLARHKYLIAGAAMVVGAAIAAVYLGSTKDSVVADEQKSDVIAPGYLGATNFEDWELLCSPAAEDAIAPESFDTPDVGNAGTNAESACRVRYEAAAPQPADSNTGAPQAADTTVVLSVSLSLVGAAQSPALMLRLPATLKEGDTVTIRDRDAFTFDVVARDCSERECIAAASLSAEQWDGITRAAALEVVFPLDETQRVSVYVPTDGLGDALSALREAQAP